MRDGQVGEKRRRALERIFLHAIHNVACGMKWCA